MEAQVLAYDLAGEGGSKDGKVVVGIRVTGEIRKRAPGRGKNLRTDEKVGNPSYLGGRDWENHGLIARPYLN
jgi:hypothetical protein